MRFETLVQGYRGADSVIMTEEQKADGAVLVKEKVTDEEVTVYAALVLRSMPLSCSDFVLKVKDFACGTAFATDSM